MDAPQSNNLSGFKRLRQEYATSIPAKLEELHTLVNTLNNDFEIAALNSFKMSVHRIAGNAGAYGFSHASELASSFEQTLFKALQTCVPSQANPELIRTCNAFLTQLEEAFATDMAHGHTL